MDLAHGFLAQQMTAHDQRNAERDAERRSAEAERRDRARAERTARSPRRIGLFARLHLGQPRGAH
ncbi:hypothetical protein [Agromyces sp. M3QZ16-3]|uniref:hypothetical protein n=1 Tax=Agromyces sp. M3QZ16-3 TaxID=3447585 RepID=UPI003F690BDD